MYVCVFVSEGIFQTENEVRDTGTTPKLLLERRVQIVDHGTNLETFLERMWRLNEL